MRILMKISAVRSPQNTVLRDGKWMGRQKFVELFGLLWGCLTINLELELQVTSHILVSRRNDWQSISNTYHGGFAAIYTSATAPDFQ